MKKIICVLLITFSAVVRSNSLEIVVPYNPGGAADTVGRAFSKFYETQYRQPLTVINRPGTGGVIGTRYVLTRQPDGNTLLVANSGSLLFNKIFYKTQHYDYSDFDILGPYAQTPSIMAVSDTSIISVDEFIKLAQRKKNINCGTSSASGAVVGESILKALGLTSAQVIIYKGSNEVITAMLGKHIDCSFDTLSSQLEFYKNKNINIIAIGSTSTHPTITTAKLYKNIVPELEFYYWYGVAISKKVDPTIRKEISNKFQNIYKDTEFRNTMHLIGLEPIKGQKNTATWMDNQYQKFNRMREEIGIAQQ